MMTTSRKMRLRLLLALAAISHGAASAQEALLYRFGEAAQIQNLKDREIVFLSSWLGERSSPTRSRPEFLPDRWLRPGETTIVQIRVLRTDMPERGLRAATDEQVAALLSMASNFHWAGQRGRFGPTYRGPPLGVWGLAKDSTASDPEAFLFHRGSWVCQYGYPP